MIEQTLWGMVDIGWLEVVASPEGLAYIPTQRAVEFFGLDELGIGVDSDGVLGFIES